MSDTTSSLPRRSTSSFPPPAPSYALRDCIIEDTKVRDYLLNLEHKDGAPKAQFFIAGGFSRDEPAPFTVALRKHFLENTPASKDLDRFGGIRITVDAPMLVPDGRTPMVRTVWVIDEGETLPRLVTAYPID
jgi:hypothetical protein